MSADQGQVRVRGEDAAPADPTDVVLSADGAVVRRRPRPQMTGDGVDDSAPPPAERVMTATGSRIRTGQRPTLPGAGADAPG